MANSPSFLISQPHPLPWIPARAPLNVVWNWPNDPYLEEMAFLRAPDGSSYDLGEIRVSQNTYPVRLAPKRNTEWLMCPPPLKRMAGCNAICSLTFFDSRAFSYFSRATFYESTMATIRSNVIRNISLMVLFMVQLTVNHILQCESLPPWFGH